MSKTIVIGLDGASFELLEPWIEEGYLPNLEKIRKEGTFGDLESQLPPVTSPNWKCYSTGKNPGKLGVFWWEAINWENQKVYTPDYRSKKNPEIWDYLNREGKKTAIINIPTSFPPKEINGYLISGGPDAGEKNYYHPPDLEKKLKEMKYNVRPQKSISSKKDCKKYFEKIKDLIKVRFDLMEDLLQEDEEIEFFHLTVFFINVLQHFLWDDDLTKKAWKIIDERIGKIMEKLDENTNLILISDHGSNKIEDVFNVNTWLENEKYLKTKQGSSETLSRLGINREKMIKIIERLGLKQVIKKAIPETLTTIVPSKGGGVLREAKGRQINWEESLAVASGQGPIYLNKKKLGENYEDFRNELIEKLKNIKSPLTGSKIIREVHKKEEIYSGKHLDKAPDLIIDQAPNVHIRGEIGRNKIFETPNKWRGENKKTGLFAAIGKDIKEGKRVDVSILDIAPTILHTYGLPIPQSMDGNVLTEIFKKGSNLHNKEVKHGVSSEKERVKNKISKLKKSDEV